VKFEDIKKEIESKYIKTHYGRTPKGTTPRARYNQGLHDALLIIEKHLK